MTQRAGERVERVARGHLGELAAGRAQRPTIGCVVLATPTKRGDGHAQR